MFSEVKKKNRKIILYQFFQNQKIIATLYSTVPARRVVKIADTDMYLCASQICLQCDLLI